MQLLWLRIWSGLKRTASAMLKIATLSPIATPRVAVETPKKTGARLNRLRATRKSFVPIEGKAPILPEPKRDPGCRTDSGIFFSSRPLRVFGLGSEGPIRDLVGLQPPDFVERFVLLSHEDIHGPDSSRVIPRCPPR